MEAAKSAQFKWDLKARVHPFNFGNQGKAHFWAWRDDEFGFSVSAGKLRKYQVLLPSLIAKKTQVAILIGGRNSNNLVGLAQYLLEAGIRPIILQPANKPGSTRGINQTLLEFLVPKVDLHDISRAEWAMVYAKAEEMRAALLHQGLQTTVIPEGCFMPEGVQGAMQLAHGIALAQRESGIVFNHVFVEAGTGTSAIGLLLGAMGRQFPVLRIVLMADNEQVFKSRLATACEWLEVKESPIEGRDYFLSQPQVGAKFGKAGPQVMDFIQRFARQTGILLDPVYSGKLFMEGIRQCNELELEGNILFVHSGGLTALPSYLQAKGE